MSIDPQTIIISRTDAIGDVVLTLPVAGVLRSLYPSARILFLGRKYTEDIINASTFIDGFLNWDEWKKLPQKETVRQLAETGADVIIHVFPNKDIARLAKQAGIRWRIGTTNRIYHWWTCNKLVKLSRKNSPYHEAQLNLKLLAPLGAKELYSPDEIGQYYGLSKLQPLPDAVASLIDPTRYNLVLHPKSKGSAREWGLDNFGRLIELLPSDKFKIFISGTAAEGELLKDLLKAHPQVTDLTGQLSLAQLLSFLSRADGLVAASTGPLHMASAVGIDAMGIYPPIRPMHPGRWAPIGQKAHVFVEAKDCEACRKTGDCACIRQVSPTELEQYLQQAVKDAGHGAK